jgi:hypothetical protein
VCSITDNSILHSNQGRAASVIGVRLENVATTAKAIVSGNKTDAADLFVNDNSVPIQDVDDVVTDSSLTTSLGGYYTKAEVDADITTLSSEKQDKVTNVSDSEIGFLDGVSSAIQTQIDAKSNIASPTFTTKIISPMVEASSNLELKASGSNAVKFYTNSVERCKVTSAGNLQFGPGLGLNLTKTVNSTLVWGSNGASHTITMNTRSGSIPYSVQYNITSVTNTFSVVVNNSELSTGSVVLRSVSNIDGHPTAYDWARSYWNDITNQQFKLMIGAGSTFDGTANGGNTAISGYINFTIL